MKRALKLLLVLSLILVSSGCTSLKEGIFNFGLSVERNLAGMKPGSGKSRKRVPPPRGPSAIPLPRRPGHPPFKSPSASGPQHFSSKRQFHDVYRKWGTSAPKQALRGVFESTFWLAGQGKGRTTRL